MMQWAGIALIAVIAIAVAAAPLFRRRDDGGREDFDAAVYRDQLREADRDIERGLLSAGQAEAAKAEIGRRLLVAAGRERAISGAPEGRWWRWAPALVLMTVLPAAALGLYANLGQPGMADQPFAKRERPEPPENQVAMAAAVEQLAQRMEREPGSLEGWLLLGRSYMSLKNYQDAAAAFGRAFALRRDRPDLAANYGEALFFAAGGVVDDAARVAFATSNGIDAANPKALFYIGLDAARQGDAQAALQSWVNLLSVSTADAPWIKDVRERIDRTAATSGIDAKTIRPNLGPKAVPY